MADKSKSTGCLLPISRVKTIMKSSPEVSAIGQESLFLIAKATELFVQDLAQTTLKRSKDSKRVTYNDLANVVDDNETLQFLQDIIPQKVKVRDYYQMIGKKMPGEQGEKPAKKKKKNVEAEAEASAEEEEEVGDQDVVEITEDEEEGES